VYDSKFEKLIAPIGLAIFLDIINNMATSTKLTSYTVDLDIKGEWTRIYSLPILNPLDIFWANPDRKNCVRFDFRHNAFDVLAQEKTLQPGEALEGWMFFEWPTELRGALPSYSRIRLQIEGAQGRKDIYILESNNTQEPG
jgi:hypothetical protein